MVRSGPEAVELIPAALGKPRDVQPMPTPTLTVAFGLQQFVDHFLEGIRRGVLHERGNLFRSRRQTNQIEIRAADQLLFTDGTVGTQRFLFVLRSDEAVDGRSAPIRVLHVRRRDVFQRLERPELAAFFEIDHSLGRSWFATFARIGSTHVDPLREVSDDFVRQLSGRRHLQSVVLQRFDQQAVGPFAFDDDRAALATIQQPVGRIQVQLGFQFLGGASLVRMARVAMLGQHRADFLLEEFDPFGVGGLSLGERGSDERCRDDDRNDGRQGGMFHDPGDFKGSVATWQ